MSGSVIHGGRDEFLPKTVEQGGFAYEKRIVTPKAGSQLHVSFMEIPPRRSAFPYHFHDGITEAFVILSGTASVRTGDGDVTLGAGEVIVFPPGPAGAHRITNASASEPLRYVDLDTTAHVDALHYPDSRETGYSVGGRVVTFWRDADEVGYYDGERDSVEG